jgi:hypothetical protein
LGELSLLCRRAEATDWTERFQVGSEADVYASIGKFGVAFGTGDIWRDFAAVEFDVAEDEIWVKVANVFLQDMEDLSMAALASGSHGSQGGIQVFR